MLRVAAASSLVALSVGCFPQCGDSCELLSPPGQGEVTKLRKLKQKCTAGEEVVFDVDYNPCTHNLEYRVNTPKRCEQRQGNVFTCLKNRRCKVTPFLTELKHCDCSKCENHDCASHQQCTLQEVQCVTAPCDKVPTCVDKPCDLQCNNGEVCEWKEVNCIQAPCDPVQTCVKVDPCASVKCDIDEVCELQDVTCVQAPCDPVPVCVEKPCNTVCPEGEKCEHIVAPCLVAPCPVVETCTPSGCPEDAKVCPDGTVLDRDPKTCLFPECPPSDVCEDEDDCEPFTLCFEGKCVDPFENTCNDIKDCNGYGCYFNENKEPTCRTTCKGEPTWLCNRDTHLCLGDQCVPMKSCLTNCGNEVPHMFSGADDGENFCNTCTCMNGVYSCTEKACVGGEKCYNCYTDEIWSDAKKAWCCEHEMQCDGQVPTPPAPAPCGKCGVNEVCYMQDVECIQAPCDPVPTCVTNHCAVVKCASGTDCLIADNGNSAACTPWNEISCLHKPCDAGYVCQDVKRVCVTDPCYQFECSIPAPPTK